VHDLRLRSSAGISKDIRLPETDPVFGFTALRLAGQLEDRDAETAIHYMLDTVGRRSSRPLILPR